MAPVGGGSGSCVIFVLPMLRFVEIYVVWRDVNGVDVAGGIEAGSGCWRRWME